MESDKELSALIRPMMVPSLMTACWPERSDYHGTSNSRTFLRRFHFFLTTFMIAVLQVGAFNEAIFMWKNNMNEKIDCFIILCVVSMALMRMIIFSYHQKNILYVIERIREDWKQSTNEDKQIFMSKCRLSFKLAKIFSFVAYMTTSCFFLPFFKFLIYRRSEYKRILPFHGYYFFNYTISPIYECVYFLNGIAGILTISSIIGGTNFCLLTTIHGSAKFAIVQKDFQSLNYGAWSGNLKKYFIRHQECINFSDKIESAIHLLILSKVLISTGLVCFLGFQLSRMTNDKHRLMTYTFFICGVISELFLYSYAGECLKTESLNIGDSVYSSKWIGSLRLSNFQIILMRCRKPCVITAGKFYSISLLSFIKVLTSSYSYLTVLLAKTEE